jgi:uncharacterized membrane protein
VPGAALEDPLPFEIALRRRFTVVAGRVGVRLERVPQSAWPVLLGAGLFVFLATTALFRQYNGSGGPDTAYFTQALDLMAHGKRPFLAYYGIDLFGDHSNYLLFALAPLAAILPVVPVLLVSQAAAGAAAVWPLWLILRRRFELTAGISLSLLVAYALHPALQNANVADFHLDLFAVPFLAGSIYFALDPVRVSRWYWVCVAGALLTREEVAVTVMLVGLLVSFRRRRVGLITVGAALVWGVLQYALVKPAFTGGTELAKARLAEYGGESLFDVLSAWITHPGLYGGRLIARDTAELAVMFLLPLAFLPLLRVRWVLPGLALQCLFLLSGQAWPRLGTGHYGSTFLPFLMVAAGAGLATHRWRIDPALVIRVLLCGAVLGWAAFSVSGPFGLRDIMIQHPHEKARLDAAGLVPDGGVVSASQSIAPLLADRTVVYAWPYPWGGYGLRRDPRPPAERRAEVEWLVFDTAAKDQWSPESAAAVQQIAPEEGFVQVWEGDGVLVYRRVPSPE